MQWPPCELSHFVMCLQDDVIRTSCGSVAHVQKQEVIRRGGMRGPRGWGSILRRAVSPFPTS